MPLVLVASFSFLDLTSIHLSWTKICLTSSAKTVSTSPSQSSALLMPHAGWWHCRGGPVKGTPCKGALAWPSLTSPCSWLPPGSLPLLKIWALLLSALQDLLCSDIVPCPDPSAMYQDVRLYISNASTLGWYLFVKYYPIKLYHWYLKLYCLKKMLILSMFFVVVVSH